MHKTWIFALAGAAAFSPLFASAAPQNSAVDWTRQPSGMDIMRLYPLKARDKGVDGNSVLDCIATVDGSLRACKIKSESPEGLGFGQAALAMANQFQLEPEIRDGKPVEVKVEVPIHFTGPGTHVNSLTPGAHLDVDPLKVYGGIRWVTTPTYADVAAIYPDKAKAKKVGGKATIQCSFLDAGKIGRCRVVNDEPFGYGFGNAALELADHFQGATTFPDGKPTKGALMTIPVVFPAGMSDGSALYITNPSWLRQPSPQMYAQRFPAEARKAGVGSSRVVLGCTIGAEGQLTECTIHSETPAGLGFGQAVLSMAPAFLMRKWTEDGQPMVGRKINMPISYELNFKDPPTAANAPPAPAAPPAS